MDKLALVLAVVALAVGGSLMFGSDKSDLSELEAAVGDNTATLARIAEKVDALSALVPVGDLLTVGPRSVAVEAGLSGAPRTTMPERLKELESRVRTQNEQLAAIQEKMDKSNGGWFGRDLANRFIHNVDRAEKVLDLDSSQRAQLDHIVESTRRELEYLYNSPNADGVTWKEVRKNKITMAGISIVGDFFPDSDLSRPLAQSEIDGEGGIVARSVGVSSNLSLHKFKQSLIPGSKETFGEAQKRIRENGKSQARDILNEDQQKRWDEAHTDALFGTTTTSSIVEGVRRKLSPVGGR